MNKQNPLRISAENDFRTMGGSTFQIIRGGLFGAKQPENNWAFVDMQNLFRGVQKSGWRIDWKNFRTVLHDHFEVNKAVAFLGYISKNKWLYKQLRIAGFTLEFRTVWELPNGEIEGGNVDADLTSYAMDHKRQFSKAVLIADDADYCNTLRSLKNQNKLKNVISSHTLEFTSKLIRQTIGNNMIISIQDLRHLIEFKRSGEVKL